ncbi:MAG: SGNH/GDSL hydrolase family protein [Acetatifactor sp.]|nr:SGNH/GDSL hydrolase family protein [Acetatifactor sp.]
MEEKRTPGQQNRWSGVKRPALYALASGAGFLLLLFLTWLSSAAGRQEQEKQTFQIVVFGDSVFGETRDETSVTALLGGLLNRTVFNAALGGTCLSRSDQECRPGLGQDMLSMTALTKAMAAHDFGPQQTIRIRESSTEYFDETIDAMAQIDLSAAEILLIGYGLNDYNRGVPIYDKEDPWNEYTFTGALQSTLKLLRETFPDQRIILVTPCYSWYLAGGKACEEYDLGGGTLDEYVKAELETAARMGVEIIDLYHDLWPHEKWEDWELYTKDGFHPNEAGRELIARRIAEYLGSEPDEPAIRSRAAGKR